ncbi:MAG: RloB family protein [Candidatus Nitrotoga sp.]|nr:RloB family protein [Candidatus Nitrotoga sp.]
MGITSRRKRGLDRQLHYRDATLCVIAVEGAKTESIYFRMFRDPSLPTFNKRVQVVPLIDDVSHKSNPVDVLRRLDDYRSDNDVTEADQFWLVCDLDHWANHGNLQTALTLCGQKNYSMAVSNPCFELWLLLHFDVDLVGINALTIGKQKKEIEKKLKLELGSYSKSNYPTSALAANIHMAIKNAKEMDNPPTVGWPNAAGTTVYKLVSWICTP